MICRRPTPPWSLLITLLVALAACGGPAAPTLPLASPAPDGLATATVAAVRGDPSAPPTPTETPEPTLAASSLATAVPRSVVGLPPELAVSVTALVDAYGSRGLASAGIIIKDAATGEAIRVNPDQPFPSASLYKPFLLWAVQEAIAAGNLRDDTLLTLTPATDDSVEDGYRLGDYGDTITVARARELMITASNNTAAWLLVEAIGGWDRIERPLRDHDFQATAILPAQVTTPREVTRFFEGIVNETLDPDLAAADYALMRRLFAAQTIPAYLSAGLPASATFAHKTANLDQALHDAGVLTLADGRVYFITVLTEGDYQTGQAFLRDLARVLSLTLDP